MLSFEFTNDSGERSKCKKKDVTRVSRELAQTYVLQPHENLVLDVNFAKVKIWEGFPAAKPGLPPVSMQAILEIPGNSDAQRLGVWSGRITSETLKVVFYPWDPDESAWREL